MDNTELDVEKLPSYFTVKVHRLMCLELKSLIDRIVLIFSSIESERPRSSSAIQSLCLLHDAIDRANMLIQHCSESSKLYLAVTGDRILSRCQKLRETFRSCLIGIQNMVPPVLAAEISKVLDVLGAVEFSTESTERDAGKAILALLRRPSTSTNLKRNLEFSVLRTACAALSVSSPLALLIEKRSIKKLIVRLREKELVNKKILSFLLYLLRKYGKAIVKDLEDPREGIGLDESFRSVSLSSSVTGSLMESLEMENDMFLMNDKDFSEFNHSTVSYNTELAFLTKLFLLPWRLQCEAVEDVKEKLRSSDNASAATISRSQIESLVRFLRDAQGLNDEKAKGDGLEVLLTALNRNRSETPDVLGDVAHTITTLFHGHADRIKSLELLDILFRLRCFKSIELVSGILPFIVEALETRVREHEVLSLRILQNLSSGIDIRFHLVYLDLIPKLIRLLKDPEFRTPSLEIIRSLCDTEEGRAAIQSIVADSIFSSGSGNGREIAQELKRILAHETYDHGVSETSNSNSESGRNRSAKLFRKLTKTMVVLSKLPSRLFSKVR